VPLRFSRKGNCVPCKGTGWIWKYRHLNDGQCYQCNGTGGERPDEGQYKVYHQSDGRHEPPSETFLGVVGKCKGGWMIVSARGEWYKGQLFKKRKAAGEALSSGR